MKNEPAIRFCNKCKQRRCVRGGELIKRMIGTLFKCRVCLAEEVGIKKQVEAERRGN